MILVDEERFARVVGGDACNYSSALHQPFYLFIDLRMCLPSLIAELEAVRLELVCESLPMIQPPTCPRFPIYSYKHKVRTLLAGAEISTSWWREKIDALLLIDHNFFSLESERAPGCPRWISPL